MNMVLKINVNYFQCSYLYNVLGLQLCACTNVLWITVEVCIVHTSTTSLFLVSPLPHASIIRENVTEEMKKLNLDGKNKGTSGGEKKVKKEKEDNDDR